VSADAAVPAPPKTPGGCPGNDDLTLCLNFEQAIDDASPRQTPVIGRQVDFAMGPSGRAARFAEAGSIEVASEELFGPSGGTIELWVSPAALGRRMGLVDGPYRLTLLPSGSAMCVASGGYALFTAAVRAETWTSLACTFDADGVALWVDGQKVRETLTPSVRRTGGTVIGREQEESRGFDGLLDNLRIWRTVRTADELCAAALNCPAPGP
jgi:hypothetical protein